MVRPIEFIRHRRESGGYEKVTTTHEGWNWSNHIKVIQSQGLTTGPK